MTASHQAQVPSLVADYFGEAVREYPVITGQFTPGRGWVRPPIRKRISLAWLRRIRREGVTGVAVTCGGRSADFTVDEILRRSGRPMLGGRVI